MAIRNKDGTIYKLQSPNKLMMTQNVSEEKYILHNFSKEEPMQQVEIEEKTIDFKNDDSINKVPLVVQPVLQEFNCLPMITRVVKDNLYGEERSSASFGSPAKIIGYIHSSSTELIWQMWSQTKIERDSVVFEHDLKRWWQVQSISEQDEWYCYLCTPSQFTPHF